MKNVSKIVDPRFEKLAEFEITIPKNFSLDKFRKKNKKKFFYFNSDIKDQNFKPSYLLTSGTRKKVLIYRLKNRLKKKMASTDHLNFIASQNGQLPNAQGLAIVWQQAKKKLPKEILIVGFDPKENFFQRSGDGHRVPYLFQGSSGDWWFRLGSFEDDWDADGCVLFLRDCD